MRVKEYDVPETSTKCLTPRDVNEIVSEPEPRRSKRQRVEKSLGDDLLPISWMMNHEIFLRHMLRPRQNTGKMQFIVKWTPLSLMEPRN
jgi:hypothetical protein